MVELEELDVGSEKKRHSGPFDVRGGVVEELGGSTTDGVLGFSLV